MLVGLLQTSTKVFLELYWFVYRKEQYVNLDPVDQTVLQMSRYRWYGDPEPKSKEKKLNQWFLILQNFQMN